jgi:hypothetical protein
MSSISKTSPTIVSNNVSPNSQIQLEQKYNQANTFTENEDFGLDDIKEIQQEKINYKEEALQLIEFQGSKFKLNPDALKIISSIENDIIVVSIVGKARTGKSYLMNLLLDRIGKETEVNFFDIILKIFTSTKIIVQGTIHDVVLYERNLALG